MTNDMRDKGYYAVGQRRRKKSGSRGNKTPVVFRERNAMCKEDEYNVDMQKL